MSEQKSYTVSKENWSLHRKGYQDHRRHMDKVREAIRNNLPDLISEESIVTSDGKNIVKIPIRSLDEYKIRYNYEKAKHVGQGGGDSKVGDVIAREAGSDEADGAGKGKGAGNKPGVDYYEAEVSINDIEQELFKDMELPDLKEKEKQDITTSQIEFNDVRKKGLIGNIDKKRTILSALRRNATKGKASIAPIYDDDLRYKTWNEVVRPESNAVVIAMMDTSGSMGTLEKQVARTFFFWMTRFLRSRYESVEMAFIAHHTLAKEVTEEEFFSKGESGGTVCSSAYEKALEIIEKRYAPSRYNIYPFHFTDGDNFSNDNEKCVGLVKEIMGATNMFGYGEINRYRRKSNLMSAFRKMDNPKFRHYTLEGKEDVYSALKSFFQKQAELT